MISDGPDAPTSSDTSAPLVPGASPRPTTASASASGWWAVLTRGPEALLTDRKPRSIDRLLPFWLRWAVLVAAFIVGTHWSNLGIGQQAAAMLQYAALVAVSLAAAFWIWFGAANAITAGLWFLPFRDRDSSPVAWVINQIVTFLNRHAGHLEALFVWLVISLVAVPRLRWQLPFFVATVLLGLSVINQIALLLLKKEKLPLTRDELYWRRRPFIYLATFLGLGVLALRATEQALKLAPLALAIGIGGLLPRYVRHRRVRAKKQDASEQQLQSRRNFRQVQLKAARPLDVLFGPVAIFALLGFVMFESWNLRRQYQHRSATASVGSTRDDICQSAVGGPVGYPDVSLFVVADTQLHELGGDRFPGQTEMAEAVVPVAVRPVELDLLSAATFWQLGNVYLGMKDLEAKNKRALGWVHLGDVADLGCVNEMARVKPLFDHMGVPAGIAAGNHDSSFTGNFFWNPYWGSACLEGRLEKADSDRRLLEIVKPDWQPNSQNGGGQQANAQVVARTTSAMLGSFTGRGGALVMVSPLGHVHHRNKPRGLVGVFVDTADGDAFDRGVAGLFGTFSTSQAKALDDALASFSPTVDPSGTAHDPVYDDPIYLVFAHHPMDEIAWPSRERLKKFLRALDERGPGGASGGPRVLALVTAHTHIAEQRDTCIESRNLRELVVGSTIDPPQQAAVLAVGSDTEGTATLRLTTLPAVARTGKTCPDTPPSVIGGDDCQRRMAALRQLPECKPLFERTGDPLGPDCQTLERQESIRDRIKALPTSANGFDPKVIKDAQAERARHLFACVCRNNACIAPTDPLNDGQYSSVLNGMMTRKDRLPELVCLSWAAAALQEHKAAGMQMADALRCSFEDGTIPAAREMVSTLEARPCR